MSKEDSILNKLKVPLIMTGIFYALAVVLGLKVDIFYLFNFGFIGTALGVGFGLYALLPKKRKPMGRLLAQGLVGFYMLGFLGFLGKENMQIEGFFFYLFAGLFYAAVLHYLIAKIFGPLIFSRGWCGWACWTAMILDLLPYKRNKAGRVGGFGFIRYLVFLSSLVFVVVVWFFGDPLLRGEFTTGSLYSLYIFIGGKIIYYLVGIVLAFALKDNRAFCKYFCPITLFLKAGARFSALKIEGDKERCTSCRACDRVCPMDINISSYVADDKRVLATECIICQTCVNSCPEG
ncbi:MAG: 4Fe-4S binding protein, partial [Deltaproteobacteria bacterium]